MSLLSRSACSLQSLSLTGTNMTGREFLECLRALPSLVDCSIEDEEYLEDWVLGALVYSEGGHILVPKLESFSAVDCYGSISDFDEAFMDMVESRWWPVPSPTRPPHRTREVSRLSFAELSCPGRMLPVDVGLLQRKAKLCRQGFKHLNIE
jgi:hypothetical protein